MPVSFAAAAASAPSRACASVSSSCARYSCGAVSACSWTCWRASSAAWKSGSLDFWSCSSVSSFSSSVWSTCSGPDDRSMPSSGRGGGIAAPAPTFFVGAPGSSSTIGTTALGVARVGSGGAAAAAFMSFSEDCLPPLMRPPTSPFTLATLPDSLKFVTSLRFLGVAASIDFLTAAMNARRSKPPGSARPSPRPARPGPGWRRRCPAGPRRPGPRRRRRRPAGGFSPWSPPPSCGSGRR